MKLLAFLTLGAFMLLFVPTEGAKGVRKSPKEITPFEKVIMKILAPQLASKAGVKESEIQDYVGVFEMTQLDFPSLTLLWAGFGDNFTLPEFHFENEFEYCYIVCLGWIISTDFKGAVLRNAPDTKLTTSFNGTKFQLDFHIPNLHFDSPDFMFDFSLMPYETKTILRDMDLHVKNYTISFSGDIIMQPVGLQMANLDFNFNVDEMTAYILNNTFIDEDGNSRQEEPFEYEMAGSIMEFWEEAKEEFSEIQEIWLNCFLSDGRVEWKDCDQYLSDTLHRQSFAQIIHAIGLGQLLAHP